MKNKKQPLKVLSYNIHRGLSPFTKKDQLEICLKSIKDTQADIICLQEVWGHLAKETPVLDELAAAHWEYRTYGKNVIFENGHQGNAVLSRFYVKEWENLDVSIGNPLTVEKRGCLILQVIHPENEIPIIVINVHLGLKTGERKLQLERLVRYLKSKSLKQWNPESPVLITGDFNDWRGCLDMSAFSSLGFQEAGSIQTGKHFKTFPSYIPIFSLDRIYYRRLELVTAERLPKKNWWWKSDHLPVLASFHF